MHNTENIYWHNFVHNIKLLRRSHGLSEERMAEIMGISVELYCEVERGNKADILSLEVVYKLSDFFGTEPYSLFEETLNM